MIRAAVVSLVMLAAATAAPAQTATPDSENGRYTFRQMGDELLRLDGRTGHVSTCSKRAAGWACLTVPDERTALETEIVRLQGENATLKRELISRGVPLPSGMSAPPRSNELTIRLPNEEDLDRVMGFMEKAWQRLLDMVWVMQKRTENKT